VKRPCVLRPNVVEPARARRPTLTIVAVCLAALAWVGAASALIVPQRSIAGIALNMTRPEVRAATGDPLRVVHGTNEFGKYTIFKYGHLNVTFQGIAGATAVATSRRGQFTSKGVHVGSTEAALATACPSLHCRTEFGDFRHCWTGTFQPGKRVTDYRITIDSRRIWRITVAFVID
jgi:hypothetical protein